MYRASQEIVQYIQPNWPVQCDVNQPCPTNLNEPNVFVFSSESVQTWSDSKTCTSWFLIKFVVFRFSILSWIKVYVLTEILRSERALWNQCDKNYYNRDLKPDFSESRKSIKYTRYVLLQKSLFNISQQVPIQVI